MSRAITRNSVTPDGFAFFDDDQKIVIGKPSPSSLILQIQIRIYS
jgi:hypothetical protein